MDHDDLALARRAAPSHLTWVVPLVMLALAVLSLLALLRYELGPARDAPIAIDEWYFAACAARGLATDQWPIAGCHDNKAPMVFLLYQWLMPDAAAYDLVRIKLVAYALVGLVMAQVAWLGFRLAGLQAALLAAALLGQVLAADAYFPGLKTEMLGSFFMLAALIVLVRLGHWPGPGRAALAGVFFGLAFVSKQSFAFGLLCVGLWWVWAALRGWMLPVRQALPSLLLFGAGCLLPFLIFAAWFSQHGRLADFMGSMFLYPAAYRPPADAFGLAQKLAWKAGGAATFFSNSPLAAMAAFGGAALVACNSWRRPADSFGAAALFILLTCGGMLALLMIAPVLFTYHTIPAWILMSVLGAVAIERLLRYSRSQYLAAVCATLLTASAMAALTSWFTTGNKKDERRGDNFMPALDLAAGSYAYVLGMWPTVYVKNRVVPASDVMFPSALPGAPPAWAYTPPDPATALGRRLLALQQRNAEMLLQNFRETPPQAIVIVDAFSRAPQSQRLSDIDVIEDYLTQHCHARQSIGGGELTAGTLYECTR